MPIGEAPVKKAAQTTGEYSREPVGFEWLQGSRFLPETILARVLNGILPMLLIPRVRIRSVEEKGLSAIELFLLKSMQRHGSLKLDEVGIATGIPCGPLQVLLNRLVRQGLLSSSDEGFTAVRDALEKAVETGSCPQEV
ncbi:MAG: hypothetical protein JWM99_2435, partial [Verrucomicrobiales bacterium]|nr:hypothetical protein [Verrucomicrobiales bacterium]